MCVTVKLLLQDIHLSPELYSKILKWLKEHSYLDTREKDWRTKLSCLVPSKAELKSDDNADAVAARDLDISDVSVKSVPPRRRTVGNIRIMKEDNVISLWNNKMQGNGVVIEQEDTNADHGNLSEDSILDGMEEVISCIFLLRFPFFVLSLAFIIGFSFKSINIVRYRIVETIASLMFKSQMKRVL